MLQAASIAVKVTESNALDISKNIKCMKTCVLSFISFKESTHYVNGWCSRPIFGKPYCVERIQESTCGSSLDWSIEAKFCTTH